jgi:hypothetical protein
MADTVRVHTIAETREHIVVHCTNISDGTGESDVVKVDKSAIGVASDGAEAGSLDIERVVWNCDGMQVRVEWDHTTDDLAMVLSGSGEADFMGKPGWVGGLHNAGGLKDPRSTGGTGDILFTTSGHTSGDTYNVTLWLRKNPT